MKSIEERIQVKKHIKAGEGHEGGIFTVEAPLHASNVQVVDPVTGYCLLKSWNLRSTNKFHIHCRLLMKLVSYPRSLLMQETLQGRNQVSRGWHESKSFKRYRSIWIHNSTPGDSENKESLQSVGKHVKSSTLIVKWELNQDSDSIQLVYADPKDTPMGVVLEKTYDSKTGKGMPHL
ncbi:50S ribosomal protein L24 [Linum perenne]